jgi:DNA-binding XRE family transcriptional regulator
MKFTTVWILTMVTFTSVSKAPEIIESYQYSHRPPTPEVLEEITVEEPTECRMIAGEPPYYLTTQSCLPKSWWAARDAELAERLAVMPKSQWEIEQEISEKENLSLCISSLRRVGVGQEAIDSECSFWML